MSEYDLLYRLLEDRTRFGSLAAFSAEMANLRKQPMRELHRRASQVGVSASRHQRRHAGAMAYALCGGTRLDVACRRTRRPMAGRVHGIPIPSERLPSATEAEREALHCFEGSEGAARRYLEEMAADEALAFVGFAVFAKGEARTAPAPERI